MSFWSTEKLKSELTEHIISPYSEAHIKYGAYELSLGKEYYTTSEGTRTKKKLTDGEQLSIEPGQFALLTTDETVNIPAKNLCFISIKAGIKFRGLVNVSGFHVDPGYKGRLKFSVYNAGSQSINITHGKPLFMIWFAEFDAITKDTYNGKNGGDEAITSDDVMKLTGDVPSPAQLYDELKETKRRIDVLEGLKKTKAEFWRNFIIAITAVIFSFGLGTIFSAYFNITEEKKPQQTQQQNVQSETTLHKDSEQP